MQVIREADKLTRSGDKFHRLPADTTLYDIYR